MTKTIILATLAAITLHGQNPNTAAFPTSLPTDTTLAVAKRLSQSTLSASATSGATTITVSDGTQFLTGEIIRIDSEELQVTGISSNTLTVTRAFNSTTAASHTSGATVQGIITSWHHNQMAAEMQAIGARLRETTSGCVDAGSNDTYACSLAPAIASYVTGSLYRFKAATANTGAATVDFNSVGAKTIKKTVGGVTTDLADNDIRAGMWVIMIYDGTNMQMINQLGNAIASVAWGAITGTLASQTDVQSAITSAAGTAAWGGITGTLSSQTDLQNALNAKLTTATLQAGTPGYCRSTSGNDTYVCALTPALTAYTRGGCLTLDGDTANTGTATVNVDSLGAKSILNRAGSALSSGDITANKPIGICYDGTQYIIQGDGGGGSGTPSLPEYTVSGLPAYASNYGLTVIVTDAADVLTCNSGGGSVRNICAATVNGWKPVTSYEPGQGLTSVQSGAQLYYYVSPTAISGTAGLTTTSSSGTTYTATVPSGLYSAYTDKNFVVWNVGSTACTGSTSTTLNIEGTGAKRIYRSDGTSNPLATECPAGAVLLLVYDISLTGGAGGWRIVGGKPDYSIGTGLQSIGNALGVDFGTVTGLADTSTISGDKTFTGQLVANAATRTAPNKSGTSLPGTCTVGDTYTKTDAAVTNQGYFCTATNTWTQQATVTLATGTSVTLVAPAQFYACTSTCAVTVPVPAAGYQFCIVNGNNVSTVITLVAIGSSARYENTARTAYGTAGTGTLVSGGAAGDKVCILGLDSTHYLTVGYQGTWTAN